MFILESRFKKMTLRYILGEDVGWLRIFSAFTKNKHGRSFLELLPFVFSLFHFSVFFL